MGYSDPDPRMAPSQRSNGVVLGQLTIPTGQRWRASLNAQGNHRRSEDWRQTNVRFAHP